MAPIRMKNTRSHTNTRGQTNKSKVEAHNEKLKKLEAERAELVKKQDQGLSTEDDETRLSQIDNEIKKYNAAIAQVTTAPESSAAAGQHATEEYMTEDDMVGVHMNEEYATEEYATEEYATKEYATEEHETEQRETEQRETEQRETDQNVAGQNATVQNATVQNATVQNATVQNATVQNATVQNATVNRPEPITAHANAQESPSKHGDIKREHVEESNVSANRLVDDLGMTWDINTSDTYVEPSLQNQNKEVIGHIMRTSQARYCVRYGSADARSARFEASLPDGSKYRDTRDVTQRSTRIVERIVQFHKDRKRALPMNILSKAKILLVYWDSKMGVGHDAEVDVLAPDYPERRPHTRCFIYLDPALYAKYGLENKTGYSHETRSTMKLLMEGNDDRQKSISLHNIAVGLENAFEEKWMSGVSGRPEPLRELVHERKVVSRRTRLSYATAEPSTSLTPMKPPISPRQSTPPISPRQPTPPQETRHEQAPTGAKPGMSPKQRFHKEYLELFDLAGNVTYAELTEQQQLLYPAQFTKWKAVNS